MKCLNKVVSLFLCLSMFILNVPFTANAAEGTSVQDAKKYDVPVISNEYEGTTVSFYEIAGKYYLDVQDIKDFTRCEIEETDTTIKLVHGLREIEIEKASGHMIDSAMVDQGNIHFFTYEGRYLCEGIPMLVYLGAGCALRDNNALEVLMPNITIWESLMPDYTEYWFNIVELYDGENKVKISLICDILSDVLDGVSGHGLFADADTHLEDALFQIIDVDMMKYESAQESAVAQNQALNDFLDSDSVLNFLDTGSGSIDTVSGMLEYYADFYLDTEILKNDIKWLHSYRSRNLKEASELSSTINKQVYEQSTIKANLNTVNNIADALDIGMLALDTAVTSYNLMQYDDDTRTLFSRNINKDIFAYAGYNDISWNNVSDRITNKLSSNASIVASTAAEKITKFTVDKGTEMGAKGALSFFTSKANIYVAATQLATFVTSLTFKNLHEAYSADMNAIWLNTVQYDIAQMASRMLLKERDEGNFMNVDSLEKLKNMFALYYRTSIAFSENMAISVNEFGGKNKAEWVSYFASTEGASVSNDMAIYLWKITNCTIVPIVDYARLSDTLIASDWIAKYETSSVQTPAPVISEEALYQSYLRETLVPKYGIACDYELRGTMVAYQDEWLSASGIIAAYIEDLDANQSKELCVFRLEEQVTDTGITSTLYTELYGIEAGAVVIKDQIAPKPYTSNGSPIKYGRNLGSDEQLYISSVKSTDGKFCFLFENRSVAKTFANGQYENFWTMQYVDGKLTYALALTQTAGGSSGFAYSGYVLENGEALSQETLGPEGDFDLARESFFGKNGLAVKFKDRNGKSVLADNSEAKLLLSINNTSLGTNPNDITYRREGETAYLFAFKITDYTELAKGLTDDLEARYASYRTVIQDYENQYGALGFAAGGYGGKYSYSTGLSFVQLRDLDRDGREELILAYHTDSANEFSPYRCDVWSYTGEKNEMVFSTQLVHSGNAYNLVSFTLLNVRGIKYLFTQKDWGAPETDPSLTILQMKGGKCEVISAFYADYTDRDNPILKVNDTVVPSDQYDSEQKKWFAGAETYPIGAWTDQEYLTALQNQTKAKLGATVPELAAPPVAVENRTENGGESKQREVTEDEAMEIVKTYWNYAPEGDGTKYIVKADGLSNDGKSYTFRLRWEVTGLNDVKHWSTIDGVAVDIATGALIGIEPWSVDRDFSKPLNMQSSNQ